MFFLNYPLFLGGILEILVFLRIDPLKSLLVMENDQNLRLLHAMISNLSASRLVILVRRD